MKSASLTILPGMDTVQYYDDCDEEKVVTVPGVKGTLVVNDKLSPKEFERQRRLELKSFSNLYHKNDNSSGPTAEESALFAERHLTRSTDIKPGEERSILHCKNGDFLRVPLDAPDTFKYYKPDQIQESHLPKGTCVHTLRGHTKPVSSIAFLPKHPHLLVSAGVEGRAKVWSAVSGTALRTFMGHSSIRLVLPDDSDTPSIMTLSTVDTADKHQIRVWEVESGSCVTALHLKKAPTAASFFHSPKRLLIGQQNGQLQLWDLHNHTLIRQFDTKSSQEGPIRTISLLGQSEFVTTGEDRVIRLWNSYDSVPVQQLGKPDVCDIYTSAAVHPTEPSIIFSSMSSNAVHLFKLDDQRQLKMRSRHLLHPQSESNIAMQVTPRVVFSPDGRFVGGTSRSGRVQFWDWKSGQPAKRLAAGEEQVSDIAFSPADPHMFAAGCLDKCIRLYI